MIQRDEKGHWLPGSVPNPTGRPKKAQEQAYLTAVTEAITPAELKAHILDLLTHTSWRAKYAAVELILHYGQGKPIQRTQQLDNDIMKEFIDDIAAAMKEEEQA